jgi:hypothetical protein
MSTAILYPPQDLGQLATYIKDRHEETLDLTCNALTVAMAAGDALIAAKEKVAHGEWERWCRQECGVSERLCQTYMELDRNRAAIEAKAQTTALSIDAALRFLRQSKGTARKTPQNCTRSHAELSAKVLASLKNGLSLANDDIANDHEIASAIRAANRLLTANKFDLHDLEITIGRSGARR